MTTKSKNISKTPSRRKALALLGGGLLGATQLPKAWTRPVVNSIVLPVHAQTTTPEIQSQPDDTPAPTPQLPTHFRDTISFVLPNIKGVSTEQDSPGLLSLLINDAQAGFPGAGAGDLSIDSPDGINFTAKLNITTKVPGTLLANGQINGAPANLVTTSDCDSIPIGTISVTTITASGAPYNIDSFFGKANGVLPVGLGEPATSAVCFPIDF